MESGAEPDAEPEVESWTEDDATQLAILLKVQADFQRRIPGVHVNSDVIVELQAKKQRCAVALESLARKPCAPEAASSSCGPSMPLSSAAALLRV